MRKAFISFLAHSMKIYIKHRVIHLEAVLVVALIAVARKIVVLAPEEMTEETLGIAAMVLALTLGYYLVRRSPREEGILDPERKG